MATGQHNSTRRGMLGLLAAAPLMAGIPAAATVPISKRWDAARRAYETAKADRTVFTRTTMNPAEERFDRMRASFGEVLSPQECAVLDETGFFDVEERCNELIDLEDQALEAMMLTGAPDMAALAYKMEHGVNAVFWRSSEAESLNRAILTDVMRLAAH